MCEDETMRVSWKELQKNKKKLRCLHCNSTNVSFQTKNKCKKCANYISRYGLNSTQIQEMYAAQNRKCFLCDRNIFLEKQKKVANLACVDHDHKTGKVRSILCHQCNVTIGYIENRQISAEKIKIYLVP